MNLSAITYLLSLHAEYNRVWKTNCNNRTDELQDFLC